MRDLLISRWRLLVICSLLFIAAAIVAGFAIDSSDSRSERRAAVRAVKVAIETRRFEGLAEFICPDISETAAAELLRSTFSQNGIADLNFLGSRRGTDRELVIDAEVGFLDGGVDTRIVRIPFQGDRYCPANGPAFELDP